MSRTVEIIAKYLGTKRVFDNPSGPVVIGSIRLLNGSKQLAIEAGLSEDDAIQPIGVKGEASYSDLQESSTYRFLGTWSTYFNKFARKEEKQFHFRTFVEHVPHDAAGLAGYIALAGRGHGIGPIKAKQLVEHFGVDDVLEKCRSLPGDVARVAGIKECQARGFAKILEERKKTENATLEVDKLLTGRGFPRSLVKKVIIEWGNKAAQIILDDPYRLMQFRGVGFRLCDKLYMELQKDPTSIDRQALCLWYAMASDMNGHTWFPAAEAVKGLQQSIGGAGVDYKAAIVRGREYGQIDQDHYGAIASIRTDGIDGPLSETGKSLWLAEGKAAAIESDLASLIVDAMTESESQMITIYADEERTELVQLDVMRCARCGRELTSEEVFVVDDRPYGPTCIQYVMEG